MVPAQFFMHRHIYGKWACRCCQILWQEPAQPRIIDGGIASVALVAHTPIARCVDHLPYYRQESINARTWQAEGQFTDMDAAQRLAAREAIAKALDYSLKHWAGLTRHLSGGDVPVSNNHLENIIRRNQFSVIDSAPRCNSMSMQAGGGEGNCGASSAKCARCWR